MVSSKTCVWIIIWTIIVILVLNSRGVPVGEDTLQCIYNPLGTCVRKCPPGTVAYTSDCDSIAKSQRTCSLPVSRDMGAWCGLSRCDCLGDLVWDETAEKCVLYIDCSTQYA